MREVDRVRPPLRRNGILLCQDKTHDLAKLDVVQEELYMDGIGLVFGRSIGLIVDEVVGRDHLHIRVLDVDAAWATKSYSD